VWFVVPPPYHRTVALPAEPGLDSFLSSLVDDPRLVHVEHLPVRAARHAQLATPLPEIVRERLGVTGLWTHQAEAIDHLRAGRSVAVATGTASGKSLCFQAPIAEAVATGLRPATSLLLFPTKALAQDQLRSLTALEVPGLVAATYDGDCSPEERTWVRANANVVLTNPEMLHVGLLPHHAKWATFFLRLRYVVIDELHTLRGIFGSHVAHLLRRLRRICAHYGSSPTFVFTSATIGQPGRLASELCGLPVEEVTDDGSPRGERIFVLWNPAGDDVEGGRSTSSARDTAELMSALVTRGHRTIAFCRSRKGTELVAADVKRRLRADLADSVRPYRGGYLAGRCAVWWPRRRSSSASTSAASTPASSTASPAPSPRCGSRRGAPGARARPRWRRWSPATTSSTSGSCTIPPSCSPGPPSRP
jgi:DEAD/DEAH box helicase domain-containing protein